jgi:hypothetical protein
LSVSRQFVVREVDGEEDIEHVRRLVRAHGDARATTPGVGVRVCRRCANAGPVRPSARRHLDRDRERRHHRMLSRFVPSLRVSRK